MSILLFPNETKDKGLSVTKKAAELLQGYGEQLILPQRVRPLLCLPGVSYLPDTEALAAADIIITIGGDGTLLRTGITCVEQDKPVLGINLGRLGFLAMCEVGEMPQKLELLAKGRYTIESRSLLEAVCHAHSWRRTAINDVTLFGASRLHPMDYTLYCDDTFVSRYRSDGVILSTPTGSTAYSLSAGGPVLDAAAPIMLFTPVCAHSLHAAPFVFAESRRLRIVAEQENRGGVTLCADSQSPCTLAPGESVEITIATEKLKLITFDGAEPFCSIEKKLTGR